jgi:cyclomaltodextrin glucanotransferase
MRPLFVWFLIAGTVFAQNPSDYRSRTIYFLVTDRFHAHEPYSPYIDPQYPDATNSVNCFIADCTEEAQWRSYWGGDISGIVQKLGYLRRLGVSALWATPLMENVRSYESGTGYGTGYHGYWVQNYYNVNPHFGSWEDVEALSTHLHEMGARYVQDITLNHSNPLDNHEFGRLYGPGDSEQIFIDSYTNDQDPVTGAHLYKHFNDDPRCEAVTQNYMETKPDSQWSYWQLHHCLLADLSGYDQRNPRIADYLIGAGAKWLDHGVDDLRLDAIKFPFPNFVSRFTHSMINHLASLGRPTPYIVGEWSNGGVTDAKSLRFANSFERFRTNILDFQLSFELNRFVGGEYEYSDERRTGQELDRFLHRRVDAFQGRDTWQGTFIDNHDQMRTMVRLEKLGVPEPDRERRLDLATVLLLTVRGVPIIFYGDEQYLAHYNDGHNTPPQYINSDNDDPYNRAGMTSWDEQTPAFKIISALANERKHNRALSEGEYKSIYADDDLLVFERTCGEDIVFVAVNRGERRHIALPGGLGLPPGFYKGLLEHTSSTSTGNFVRVAQGGAVLQLNRLGSIVVAGKW